MTDEELKLKCARAAVLRCKLKGVLSIPLNRYVQYIMDNWKGFPDSDGPTMEYAIYLYEQEVKKREENSLD